MDVTNERHLARLEELLAADLKNRENDRDHFTVGEHDAIAFAVRTLREGGSRRPHCENCCGTGEEIGSDEQCRDCHGTGDAPTARYWREDAHYWRERALALRAALEPLVDYPEDTFNLGPQDTFTMTVLGSHLHEARDALANNIGDAA